MMLNNYQRLFPELETQGVKYCSWKNNHLLERESNGDGDIDRQDLFIARTELGECY